MEREGKRDRESERREKGVDGERESWRERGEGGRERGVERGRGRVE